MSTCPVEATTMRARVLITVSGGVAEHVSDGNVDVELIDYDNEPKAVIPALFAGMVDGQGYHCSRCVTPGCDSLARTIPGKPSAFFALCETCYAKLA